MKITAIHSTVVPIASQIRNAYIDFSKMTSSVVALVTDVVRDGRRVVGYGFNSNGRYAQEGLLRERFIPRVMQADARSLLNDEGTNLDPERVWAVALGDVCGKGPEAAALTGLVRHTIRTAAARDPKPSDVLARVNAQILGSDNGRFCTVALGTVHPSNDHLDVTVSCGGHPPPLILRPTRTVEAAECIGTLLGVFPDPELVDSPLRLGPGDSIVFYTDGVTERFDRGGEVGDARLVALLWDCEGLDAGGIADRIYREAALASPGAPRDDIAVVVLRVPG